MKIIILGAGQVGSTIAESLCTEHDVTVIDRDARAVEKLQSKFDVQAICGEAILPSVLKEAGAAVADMLIAVTSNDESNIIACEIAHFQFQTPIKIARIKHTELHDFPNWFAEGARPIDLVIDPAAMVTEQIEEQIRHPAFAAIWNFAPDKNVRIASIAIAPLSSLKGISLQEIQARLTEAKLLAKPIALMRNQQILFADEVKALESYDALLIIATENELNKVGKILLGSGHESYQHVMIAGGGRIGSTLTQALEKDAEVKLIEISQNYSEKAAQLMHHALVLQGDATDVDLLKQENIENMDLFCSVTNEDDVNIMSAILAKRLGARHTIALVNQQRYAHYLSERSPDIDITISPQYITGSRILRMLYKNTFANIYPIFHGAGYLIEIILKAENPSISRFSGTIAGALKIPKSYFLAAVYRNGMVYTDLENVSLMNDDHLIFMLRDKKDLGFFTHFVDGPIWE